MLHRQALPTIPQGQTLGKLQGASIEGDTVAVQALQSRTSKHPITMHLLRCLHFFLASHDIALHAQHIPGATNHAADALFHNNMQAFHALVQEALPPIPILLWDLLVVERPDWTSPRWRSLLSSSNKVLLHPQPEHTTQERRHT